jgi:pimeloyl-ACP methyl ester carboxylesterase
LCELFWDIPDDPRAALRWSLSKLRPILNADGCSRLVADRERVQVKCEEFKVDFHELRDCARDEESSLGALVRAWEMSEQPLLSDCELPNQSGFMAWLEYQRSEHRRYRVRVARRLALSRDMSAEEGERWAQRWLLDAPLDAHAAQHAVHAKRRIGREEDAAALAAELESTFRQAGVQPPDFTHPGVPLDIAPVTAAKVRVTAAKAPVEPEIPRQTIRFVQAEDQTTLAWASVGAPDHPPLVKAANWLTHLELDWEAPIWSPLYRDLARTFRLIRYDERGCGLSDWEVPQIGFETFVSDLEMVVEAAGLERFALLGAGQGASVSIEYAARHPERVSHLILFGGYAAGWRHTASAEEAREREALMVLTEAGWGREMPAYRNFFSRSFMPDANDEELRWFDEFQRRTTSPGNAVRFLEAFSRIDVRERLKDVRAPTLVIHSRGDMRIPVATGCDLATRIPNAEFLGLDSNNHLLLGREPASFDFLQAVRRFIGRT